MDLSRSDKIILSKALNFGIIDENRDESFNGELICSNDNDPNDCDLYFIASLKAF